MKSTADIIVVGAGVIGASVAYYLAKKGPDVLVLDRGAVGGGETSKCGGFIQTHWDDVREVRLIAHAREVFADWDSRIGGDCGWVKTGYLHVTGERDEANVRRVHGMLLDEGLESQWIEPTSLRELQPILHVDDLVGGAFEPGSGIADPMKTTLGLADAARRHGATFEEGVAVLQVCHKDGRIIGVESARGFIASPVVVLAVGPWTQTLHPNPTIQLPIVPKRGQVCYVDRPGGLPHEALAFYDEVTGLYTHADGDRNLVGIDWEFDEVWTPDAYKRKPDVDYVQHALEAIRIRLPAMAEAKLVGGVVGLYDFTPDGQPIVDGPLGIDGYYVAAGFSGSGFKSAPATGLALAELILEGRARTVDIDLWRYDRFAAAYSGQGPG
jgi:sarcosine oxidase subunit beta